jgi:hypothetical protein
MIKLLKIGEKKRKEIEERFGEEIRGALSGRDGFHSKCAKWRKNFEAEPDREQKNFPWEKASNLVIPIQAITVNAYVARQMNILFALPPFWIVKALNPKWTDHAVPTQNMLDYYQRQELKLEKQLTPFIYDQGNLGIGVAKQIWVSEMIHDKVYTDNGDIISADYLDDGPRFIPIAIEDAVFPIDSIQDIQLSPWFAHRFRLTWERIKARSKKVGESGEPIYINTEELEGKFVRLATERVEKQEEIEKLVRALELKEHELFEVWADYDYDEDGRDEKVCLTFHNSAQSSEQVDLTLIRPILNPWSHRLRPFLTSQCFPRPHRVLGIGFGQRLERLQEGLSTTANQSIDNWSVSNAKLITYKKGLGIKTPLKIWPGKCIAVSEHTDLSAFSLGDAYASGQIIINFLKDVSERVTGVSDYWLGRESSTVGSSATATSTLALIQEGMKLFDFLMKNTRGTMNDSAYMLYMSVKQMKPKGTTYPVLGEKEAELVEQTWNVREGDVKKCLEFDLAASSAYANRMVERQSWMDYFNLILGYYERVFDASQLFFDPQAPLEMKIVVAEMIMSAHLIMERISQQWDIKDVDRVLFNPENLIQMELMKAQQMEAMGGGASGQGAKQRGNRGFGGSSRRSSGVESGTGGAPVSNR